jgi:hypothetical protein
MKKISLALALGTGLTLGLAAPSAQAAAISLTPTSISATDFSNQFDVSSPLTSVQSSSFQFDGAPPSGTIQSQVFKGIGPNAGLFAYAYQVDLANVTTTGGSPIQLNSASWRYNAIPTSAYLVSGGPVGNLTQPSAGATIQAPAQLNFDTAATSTGTQLGSLTAQFLDTKSPISDPLNPGASSGTFVVLSKEPPTTPTGGTVLKPVNVNGPDAIASGSTTTVYVPGSAVISPVPAPEPTTVLAWAGVLGGVALVRRVRKNRAVIA